MGMNAQNVFLIGPMGAGKTTIGRQLASQLARCFYDSDHEVEERSGVDIAWIFDVEGEAGFREREKKVIDDLTNEQGIVLATGGGAIISPENRRVLAARGIVVYLSVSVEHQLKRTIYDQHRPQLKQASDREAFLRQQYVEREPLYEEIADFVFVAEKEPIRSILKKILRQLEQPV